MIEGVAALDRAIGLLGLWVPARTARAWGVAARPGDPEVWQEAMEPEEES